MKYRIPRPDTGDPASGIGHVAALDGVRGLAILAVMGVHMFASNSYSPHVAIRVLLTVRNQLWVGVVLFFALSGFLITGILFDTLNSRNYFRTFFGRRALRIFPLYYGVLGVLLLFSVPFHLHWQGQAYRLLTYTPNILFLPDWGPNPSIYLNLVHFWSLAVEEQFYLLWPLLVFWLRSWRKIFFATLIGVAISLALRTALAMAGMWPGNHTLPGCMDSLLMGGSLALLVRSRHRERVLSWGAPVFLATVALTLFEALTHKDFVWEKNFYLTTIGMTVLSLGMTGFIAAALRTGSVAQIFCGTRILRFFGRYSYGLYVYHYSLYETTKILLAPLLVAHAVSKPLMDLSVGLLSGSAAVVMAVLSYELYEKHFLRLKRHFPYRQKTVVTTVAV